MAESLSFFDLNEFPSTDNLHNLLKFFGNNQNVKESSIYDDVDISIHKLYAFIIYHLIYGKMISKDGHLSIPKKEIQKLEKYIYGKIIFMEKSKIDVLPKIIETIFEFIWNETKWIFYQEPMESFIY